jgi:hypothetical protein
MSAFDPKDMGDSELLLCNLIPKPHSASRYSLL